MPESEQEREKRELEELKGKNIAHYQLMLSAWIQSRMERDKAIITLSSWAIGLFVTLMVALYDKVNLRWPFILAVGSIGAFCFAILISLSIFQKNTKHIEQSLRGETPDKLEKFDKQSIYAFITGIVLFVAFISIVLFNSGGGKMVNKDTPKKDLKESVQGINNLAPQETKPKATNVSQDKTGQLNNTSMAGKEFHRGSLDGAGDLSPQNLKPEQPAKKPQSNSEQTNNTDNSGEEKK